MILFVFCFMKPQALFSCASKGFGPVLTSKSASA